MPIADLFYAPQPTFGDDPRLDPWAVRTGEPEEEPVAQGWADVMGEGLDDPYILRAVFVVGAGGSGKSAIAQEMFAGRGLKVIDQDKHLTRLTLARGADLGDVSLNYGDFKDAQALARKERDAFARQRLGLVIDATGWDYERVAAPVARLRELGYDCYMVFVSVELDTALARNLDRAEQGGRDVPDWSIERAWRGVNQNLPRYRKLFGKTNLTVVRNDKQIDPATWAKAVAPFLYRLGGKLLDRPLKNPAGRAWVKKQWRAQRMESRPTIVLPAGIRDSLSRMEECA